MTVLDIGIRCERRSFQLNVNQQFELSGIHGIFGHSGSGKSTLLRCISGLEKSVRGHIVWDHKTLLNSADNCFVAAEKRRIAHVFQRSCLFPHMTVQENLTFAIKRRVKDTIPVAEIIELAGLKPLLSSKVTSLSGGEQQKVALARAILFEPDLLLLDEPLSALDRQNKRQLLSLIKRCHAHYKIPMLYVTHAIDELQQIATDMSVLERGELKLTGSVHNVIHQLNNSAMIEQQTSLSLTVAPQEAQAGGLTPLLFSSPANAGDKSTAHSKLYMLTTNLGDTAKPLQEQWRQQDSQEQQPLRCFILASDLSLCTQEPQNSSIVNQLQGEITAIEINNHQALVRVNVNEHPFFASISAFSVNTLNLAIGQTVYLQFKASAIKTLFT
ncbi:molybdenum ABC transporter ATP-binding protein [Thalassotalea litorea]|uniref:molybdenum ABC transporter ATP-binding protein n=1 Tax=Thalassotalea litorea TaxID=2020715 RepID=UPI003735C796